MPNEKWAFNFLLPDGRKKETLNISYGLFIQEMLKTSITYSISHQKFFEFMLETTYYICNIYKAVIPLQPRQESQSK